MKLIPEDRERLIRYVDFLESELEDFPRFSRLDWKTYYEDRDLRRNIERWIENLVNCSIDVAKVMLVIEDKRIPSTYREIIRALGTTEPFDEEFGEAISQWSALRNILAHEYLDLRWDSIRKFVQSAEPHYERLVRTIKRVLSS